MLEINDLYAAYGGSLILQGINLQVSKGEIIAIMGRNGMGKSTLIKAITGLVPARSGNIFLEGESISGLTPHKIASKGIGYVPQGREIFSDFTVLENMKLATLKFPKKDRHVPDELFEYFPILKERQYQRAGSFSGGEQQMLAMARALTGRPKLLLLDEPSEGIQPSIVEEIVNILLDINQKTGLTIVVVEQNVEMILDLARTCAFLEKGRIVETGLTDALLADDSLISKYMSV